MPTMTEQLFLSRADSVIDELFRFNPVLATAMGDHRFDAELSDYSEQAIIFQRERMGVWLREFEACGTDGWALDNRIDLTMMVKFLRSIIRHHDRLRMVSRNPGAAADECLSGIHLLIMCESVPLPRRMESICGRLLETPRTLEQGRQRIVACEVPEIWAEAAIESARQGLGMYTEVIPKIAATVPDNAENVAAACSIAAASLNEYADWIEREVLPNAQGVFAAGRELFDEILCEDHMVTYDADDLLATGWRMVVDIEKRMRDMASRIEPSKTVRELLDESSNFHPTGADLLDVYRRHMAEARKFVIDQRIATIPADESIRIEPTPGYMRPFVPFAAYNPPGFLATVQEGIFFVTTIDENADAAEAEKKLRSHPSANIPGTAIHEAYPGHHLQFTVANRIGSKTRKLGGFISTMFIEGWAFYCEELMERLGYLSQPVQKLAILNDQLWRAVRIVIDVSLHTKGMGFDEAIKLLVERVGLEPHDAKAEVRWYSSSPTYPQSYLMGKMEVLAIVDEYRRRNPDADMRTMHDDILGCGSLPPRLMRMRLFGEG